MAAGYYTSSRDEHFPFVAQPDQPAMPGNASYVDSGFYHPQSDVYYDPTVVDVTGCPQAQMLYDQTPYLYSDLESATLVPCPETSDGPWAEYNLVPHPEPPRPRAPTEHYAPSGRAYTYPITVSYTLAHGLGHPPANVPKSGFGLLVKHEPQEPCIKEEMCASPIEMEMRTPEMRCWHHAGLQADPYTTSTPRFANSMSAPASASVPTPAYGTSHNATASSSDTKMGALMDSLGPPPGVAISHTQFQSYSPAREAARSLPPPEQQASFFGEHRSPFMSGSSTSPAPTPSDMGVTPTWVAPDQPLVVPSQAHLAPLPSILTTALASSSSPTSLDSPDTPSLVTSPTSPISPNTPMVASSSRLPPPHSHLHSHARIQRRRASTPNTHAHVSRRSRSRSSSPKVRLSPNPSRKPLDKKPALACLFCRGRKIACGPPVPGSNDKTCNQCARRHLKCEYPVESRRGMRKRKTTFSPPALSSSTTTTSSASSGSQHQPQPQPQSLAPTQSVLNLGTRPSHGSDMDVDLDST